MSSQAVKDFLTKQLVIDNNVVTYRSLSRELAIHVNVAKNELAAYHTDAASQAQSSAATYLLSGEVRGPRAGYDEENGMDVDLEYNGDLASDGDYGDDGEDVPQTKIMLVGERNLESAKSQFIRLHTIHIYSLSPSPIRDAGLLCGPTQGVREMDQKKGLEMAIIVGKVVGAHIQMKEGSTTRVGKMAPPVAGPSKMNPPAKMAPPLEVKAEVNDITRGKDNSGERERTKEVTEKPKDKSKVTGKLDFSKAKKKKDQTKESRVAQKKMDLVIPPSTSNVKRETMAEQVETKRGIKRKSISTLPSDSEEASESSSATRSKPPSKSKPGHRVAKGVIYSDDEDNVPRTYRKGRVSSRVMSDIDSEAEKNIQAMMDVDDDQVIRVSRGTPNAQKEGEEEEEEEGGSEDGDMTMADDLPQKPKPKKRKPKKVIPVGRNGLKKKRIVKSRMTVDNKGYMATEDYSSYESVDEEEAKPMAPVQGKAKAKSVKKLADDGDSASAASSKTKPIVKASSEKSLPAKGGTKSSKPNTGSSKVVRQNSMANFFGPPKGKK